jgi:uncharacterized protein YfaS (alpha-2-macroglobulin family)
VRPAQAVASRQITSRIQASQSSTLTASVLEDFVPGTAEALITLSTRPDMGLPELLKSLTRYPYGCAEQTTSKAFPLLYVSEIAQSLGISEDPVRIRARVQDAIHRLLTMQRSDGSFGLWNSRSPREEWLSAYVMDFLTQAKELDYAVPSYPYERGLQWLKGSAAESVYNQSNMPAKVYAFYVLARAGEAELSDLRYIYDAQFGNIPTALAQAQLGAALALMGEKQRANQAFRQATRSWSRNHFWSDWRYWDYGTSTRDMAATVYLATHAKVEDVNWLDYAVELGERVKRDRYFSTQEKAWLVLAAHELGAAEPIRTSVRGKPMPPSDKPVYLRFGKDQIGDGVDIANHGDKPIWQSIAYSGVPRDPMPAQDEGFAVFRAYYTLEGRRANLSKVRQGETLVAVIHGESKKKRSQQAMVVDLLPAGFELENERLEGGRSREELRWIGDLTKAKHEELRDDRYVAAFDLDRYGKQTFRFAYLVRAVSPGAFTLPASYVEDMYQPTYFARTRMGRVTILPQE